MAELSYPWGKDDADVVDSSGKMYQSGWRVMHAGALPDGVIGDRTGNGLKVTAAGSNTTITVQPGTGLVQGAVYEMTTVKSIDLATVGTQPTGTQKRVDRVVLRYSPDATPASARLSVAVVTGTPAASPGVPSTAVNTTGAGSYEVEIGRVLRTAGTAIAQADITDTRPFVRHVAVSPNAPAAPQRGQGWETLDGSSFTWSGSAWLYNCGGPAQTAQGSIPIDRVMSNATLAVILGTDTPQVTGDSCTWTQTAGAGLTRLTALRAGTFRVHAEIGLHNKNSSGAAGAFITAIPSIRKNSGGVATGGTLLRTRRVTIASSVSPGGSGIGYGSITLEREAAFSAGDYAETFVDAYMPVAGSQLAVLADETRLSMTWVGR